MANDVDDAIERIEALIDQRGGGRLEAYLFGGRWSATVNGYLGHGATLGEAAKAALVRLEREEGECVLAR